MESIYWVFTHRCNQYCAHCYNHSGPDGPTLTSAKAEAVLANLPETNRLILSGGEPLFEKELLLSILRGARAKFGEATRLALQTNGDLLDAAVLDALLAAGAQDISVASQDRYHARRKGMRERITALLSSRGLREVAVGDPAGADMRNGTFSFWGATPDLWLRGLWARGRALRHGTWKRDPDHNFCGLWSGALGFLDDGIPRQEIAIQLTLAYPCCPGTAAPLGDDSEEPLTVILDRHRGDPMWEALNRGEPWAMGEREGVDADLARRRIRELGNVCLWCDEYFAKHASGAGGPLNRATLALPEEVGAGRAQSDQLGAVRARFTDG